MRMVFGTCVMLAALGLGGLADAGQELTATGRGVLKVDGDRKKVVEASFKFEKDDHFWITMTFEGGGERGLKGRLHGSGMHRQLVITRGLGEAGRTDGAGDVTFSNHLGELREIQVHGESDGDDYTFKFEADGRHGGGHGGGHTGAGGPPFSYSATIRGEGSLDEFGESSRVTHLRVHMSRNGDLTLHAEGPGMRDLEWAGRWEGAGPDYRVHLRRHDWHDIRADGVLTIGRRNQFQRLSLDGKEDGERFRLNFSAGGSGDSGSASSGGAGDGQGVLKIGGRKQTVVAAAFKLESDGHFTLQLDLEGGDRRALKGRVLGRGMHRQVTISRGLGAGGATDGHGDVDFANHNGEVESFKIVGETNGERYVAKFEARSGGGGGGGGGGGFSYAAKVHGSGSLQELGYGSDVAVVRVHMARNGDLTLKAEGPHMADVEWKGRWSGEGPNYEIKVNEHDWHKLRASGTLKMDRGGELKRIVLNGHEDQARFAFDFRAD